MSNTDIVREVDEELRREQIEKLWLRYRGVILTAAVLIVAMVAGYKGWQWYQGQRAATAGSQFDAAVGLLQGGKTDEATKALEGIADGGAGAYSALAQLRLAALEAGAGKADAARARYEAVAASSSADVTMRGLAQIQAAQLLLDKADFTEMQNRLNDLAKPESVWRQSARLLLGLSAYKSGKLTEANDYFALILGDKEARGPIGDVANLMSQLIVAATAKPATGAAPATKTN